MTRLKIYILLELHSLSPNCIDKSNNAVLQAVSAHHYYFIVIYIVI